MEKATREANGRASGRLVCIEGGCLGNWNTIPAEWFCQDVDGLGTGVTTFASDAGFASNLVNVLGADPGYKSVATCICFHGVGL